MLVIISLRYGTTSDFDTYRRDYIKLYVETVREIVRQEDPSRPFVVSSPSNGKESEEEGHVAKNPYSSLYGDGNYTISISRILIMI